MSSLEAQVFGSLLRLGVVDTAVRCVLSQLSSRPRACIAFPCVPIDALALLNDNPVVGHVLLKNYELFRSLSCRLLHALLTRWFTFGIKLDTWIAVTNVPDTMSLHSSACPSPAPVAFRADCVATLASHAAVAEQQGLYDMPVQTCVLHGILVGVSLAGSAAAAGMSSPRQRKGGRGGGRVAGDASFATSLMHSTVYDLLSRVLVGDAAVHSPAEGDIVRKIVDDGTSHVVLHLIAQRRVQNGFARALTEPLAVSFHYRAVMAAGSPLCEAARALRFGSDVTVSITALHGPHDTAATQLAQTEPLHGVAFCPARRPPWELMDVPPEPALPAGFGETYRASEDEWRDLRLAAESFARWTHPSLLCRLCVLLACASSVSSSPLFVLLLPATVHQRGRVDGLVSYALRHAAKRFVSTPMTQPEHLFEPHFASCAAQAPPSQVPAPQPLYKRVRPHAGVASSPCVASSQAHGLFCSPLGRVSGGSGLAALCDAAAFWKERDARSVVGELKLWRRVWEARSNGDAPAAMPPAVFAVETHRVPAEARPGVGVRQAHVLCTEGFDLAFADDAREGGLDGIDLVVDAVDDVSGEAGNPPLHPALLTMFESSALAAPPEMPEDVSALLTSFYVALRRFLKTSHEDVSYTPHTLTTLLRVASAAATLLQRAACTRMHALLSIFLCSRSLKVSCGVTVLQTDVIAGAPLSNLADEVAGFVRSYGTSEGAGVTCAAPSFAADNEYDSDSGSEFDVRPGVPAPACPSWSHLERS